MPGAPDILNKVTSQVKGLFSKSGSKQGTQKKLPAKGATTPAPGSAPKMAGAPGQQKAFDINTYFKAVGLFGQDFFGKKVPAFFKKPDDYIKQFPVWVQGLPQDEQIAYGVLCMGPVFIIVGIVLILVL